MQKLILGTAAFGSDYGIKHDGQPSIQEIERIAHVAWEGGIWAIHTSWQYNLPKICEAIFDQFDWIEKNQDDPIKCKWKFKCGGWAGGRSIYEPREFQWKAPFVNVWIVPVNILDNRFINKKVFKEEFYSYEFRVIARSVFLQGLLLMENTPLWLSDEAFFAINDFKCACLKLNLKPYEAALGWVLGLDEIDHVIVGVNSAEQLSQLLAVKPLKWDYDFSIQDENVLDPRKWPNQEKERIEFLRKHNSINYG